MDGWNETEEGTGGAVKALGLPELKARIHRKLLGRLNLGNLEAVSRAEATQAIKTAIREILAAEREQVALNVKERELLQMEILDEIFGLGPLEPRSPTSSSTRTRTSGSRSTGSSSPPTFASKTTRTSCR
jgi:hypothetical protein